MVPRIPLGPPEHPRDTSHAFSASCLRLPIRPVAYQIMAYVVIVYIVKTYIAMTNVVWPIYSSYAPHRCGQYSHCLCRYDLSTYRRKSCFAYVVRAYVVIASKQLLSTFSEQLKQNDTLGRLRFTLLKQFFMQSHGVRLTKKRIMSR